MNETGHTAPGPGTIREAAARIAGRVHHTPVLTNAAISRMLGAEILFKCENFQKVGAFKARGATNAVFSLSAGELRKGVCTHSSGNHAQALARAAALAGAKAFIVMPSNSSRIKVEAVREYGGAVTFCEPTLEARESTLAELRERTGAVEIHPYNDLRIIAGQATACLELVGETAPLDIIMAPVGGGGLLSGTALSAHYFSPATQVIAAEPEMADDAYRSFRQKEFVQSVNPQTMADGLRTSLGTLTFPIILQHVSDIVTCSEPSIIRAMRLIWERMKILVEPSSAVPLAALLEGKADIAGKRVGIILSGGNVDLDALPWIKP
jgi:threonine dehydratase